MAKSAKSNLNWKNRIVGYGEKPANQFLANPFNPRRHPGAQREALRGILSEVGWVAGVVENVTTGHIIDGHARIEEALSMNENQPIPYLQVRLSENEEKLVLATFDPLGALATYDKAQLDELLRETENNNAALQELLAGVAEKEALKWVESGGIESPEPQPDRAAELQEKWGVSRGQVWQAGKHRVMCGDSMNANDVQLLLGDAPISVCVIDPPFDSDDTWKFRFSAQWLLVFCDYKTSRQAHAVGSDYPFCYEFVWDCQSRWYTPHRPLARHKSAFVFLRDPRWNFDLATYSDGKNRSANVTSNSRGRYYYQPLSDNSVHLQTVFQYPITQKKLIGHEKPLKWIQGLIAGCGNRRDGDVFDAFLGSGTSVLACQNLNRICFGMELCPSTLAIALERFNRAGLSTRLFSLEPKIRGDA